MLMLKKDRGSDFVDRRDAQRQPFITDDVYKIELQVCPEVANIFLSTSSPQTVRKLRGNTLVRIELLEHAMV